MSMFSWTGNPWVDTGLAVIIARAKELKLKIKTVQELTPDIIEQVCKSKLNDHSKEYSWLTNINRRLNCYTMIFSSNGPLTNTSTNPQMILRNLDKKIEQLQKDVEGASFEIKKAEKEFEIEKNKLDSTNNKKDIEKITTTVCKLEIKIKKEKSQLKKKEDKLKDCSEKRQIKLDKKKDSTLKDKGLNEYVTIISGFIDDIKNNTYSTENCCEVTGMFKATAVLEENGKKAAREWFPLAGTMQDVQTLPSASRSVRLSSLSLLAAQFMPMGMAMLGGKLVCFQTNDLSINNVPIFQSMVEEIYKETMLKAELTDKVETWGKDGGYNSITYLLLGRINDLIQRKSLEELPEYICLNLWRFSNSGQDPFLEIIEIPNDAIQFLWEAWRGKLKNEIEHYLRVEQNNKKETRLLQCIKEKKEYSPFYPYKVKPKKGESFIKEPASIDMFDLYAEKILGYNTQVLEAAKWVASEIKNIYEENELQLLKEKLHEDYGKMMEIMLKLSDNGLSLEDYLILFPCNVHPLRADAAKQSISWRIIWFYLNRNISNSKRPRIGGDFVMYMHSKYPKIKSFAKDFFDYYLANEGKARFQKRILTAFKQNQVKPFTIEDWFVKLAETKEGYTNEEWDDLCRDENGNSEVWEVIFQLRLELTNLYRNKCNSQIN